LSFWEKKKKSTLRWVEFAINKKNVLRVVSYVIIVYANLSRYVFFTGDA